MSAVIDDLDLELEMLEAEAQARGPSKRAMERDYGLWLTRLMPKHFRNPDPALQFAEHHRRFFEWGWRWKPGDAPACLWIVNRGGAKSTSVAGLVVGRAARGLSNYWLVITRTEPQGKAHINRLHSMLLQSKVGEQYPGLAKPEVHEVGNRSVQGAWNRTMLTTESGLIVQSFSLNQALRGIGYGEFRPDGYWITDIDDVRDSLGVIDGLEEVLSASVLATMAGDAMAIFDQNVIHRRSVMNRVLTRATDMMSDRVTIGPVPAVYNPTYERRNNHWYITAGQASWPGGMGIEECERKLNLWKMDTWQREAQHKIDLAYPDAVYPMFDPVYHVITWSEFAKVFGEYANCYDVDGNPRLPDKGRIVMALDWGNNVGHPCAVRWAWRPSEGMGLRRDVFFYREMCWPRFPKVEGDDRAGPSPLQVLSGVQDIEKEWGEDVRLSDGTKRVQWRIASHERPEIKAGAARDLPMTGRKAMMFGSINTSKAREGILHMQNFFAVEKSRLDERGESVPVYHPFRVYPVGHPEAGSPVVGKPRVYFVAGNKVGCEECQALGYEQGSLYWDSTLGELKVRPSIDEHGQARTVYEYPNYRKPDTADGSERSDAPKHDDDVIDCDRAIAGELFPSIEPMTEEEKVEMRLPDKFKAKALEKGQNEWSEFCAYQARAAAKKEQAGGLPVDFRRRKQEKYRMRRRAV